MRTYIELRNEQPAPLPLNFSDDVRFAPVLVERFLAEYTREGDIVFDPFVGFGTTLLVAEAMRRVGVGVEVDGARCKYVRPCLMHPANLVQGDVRQVDLSQMPEIDFTITSPPYMSDRKRGGDCTQNPLSNAPPQGNDYSLYLSDLQAIYGKIAGRMKPGACAVIEVSNLKHESGITTLAWDVAAAVAEVLPFQGETVVGWRETYGNGYDHSYCLVFRKS